ncbi:hypothetical protein [Mangrovibrevibacter kandeliae]|uniref:hypothetical protein n=1 Tax=Mangrovibrevibacter kandeliae TaxID=2968473 RepID=UPI0021192E26|nr:hypothetical protein [Aurantimonas sp. CSK15Z-1]MCQ8781506.1 hypothetical protein [Aurantimonas sp. CSK15Z-1]
MRLRLVGCWMMGLALLSGCTTTEEASQAIQSRWIGQPSDAFFSAYGPPASEFALNDGSTLYTWRGGDTERQIAATYRPMTKQERKSARSSP